MTKEEKDTLMYSIKLLMVNSDASKDLSEKLNDKYWEGYADGIKLACDVIAGTLKGDKR